MNRKSLGSISKRRRNKPDLNINNFILILNNYLIFSYGNHIFLLILKILWMINFLINIELIAGFRSALKKTLL